MELIVVITILVILGTIAFMSFQGFSGSARDSSRVSDLTNLSKSLDIYNVRVGNYPTPDNAFSVTYSGGVLWKQGTVSESVMNALSAGGMKMSRKPTDPLTPDKEYTYSILAYGSAYQLKTDYEGDSVSFRPFVPGIDTALAASGNPTIVYLKGSYNGIAAKTQTGNITYLVATPSIITSQTGATGSGFDVITTLANKLFIHGQTNSGGINYTAKLVFSSGALPSTDAERILFASGIANAYSGTLLATQSNIASFIVGLSSNNTGTLASLGGGLVSTSLGGSASTSVGGGGSVGGTSYTCATPAPTGGNYGTTTMGTPTSTNQAWTYNTTPGNCTYVCTGGYSGNECAIAPIPVYSPTDSTTAYTVGNQFTYSGVTVTVTSAGVGTGSSTYAGCDTSDIVIWRSGNNPQIWAACNVGATTSVGFATVPDQTSGGGNPSATLPTNRVANVQGNYYQWGRNDNITSGTWTPWVSGHVSAGEFSNGSTSNTNFYGGDSSYGEWYAPDINVTATNRWVTSSQ